jgi:hypothetical protein
MKTREDTKIPEFQSLEEEKEYWEARGPLGEGYKGRVNKPKIRQKRSSFLAVRLTGEELTRLRDTAAKQGLGPSTFARVVLTNAIEQEGWLPKRVVTLKEFKEALERNLPQPLRDRLEAFAKDISVGGPENPALLIVDASQRKKYEQLIWSFFGVMLEIAGLKVLTSDDESYEKVKEIVKAQT